MRSLDEHPCHGLGAFPVMGVLSHRAYLDRDRNGICERCGTAVHGDNKEQIAGTPLKFGDEPPAVNPHAKASVEFDLTRPLNLMSTRTDNDQYGVYVYSTAVDGFNNIRVATIDFGLGVGLTDEQQQALRRHIAQRIVEGDKMREYVDAAYQSYRDGRCTKAQFADNILDAAANWPCMARLETA